MIKPSEYIQLKAFARMDGAIMGVMWIISFACFTQVTRIPGLSMLFDLTLISTPVLASFFVRRYRDKVIGGRIGFWKAYGYCLLMFIYASLILAIGQWAYLEFLDHGRLVGGMIQSIHNPEMKDAITAAGYNLKEIEEQLNLLAESRPIDFVLSIIWMNLIISAILSWFIALFSKRTK